MSNTLLKKATASIAALSVVVSMVSPVVGVKADDAAVDAANRLAALGVIVDNAANPSAYNLDGSITRREMLKIMMNLSSVEVTDTCEGTFADLDSSDWGCKYAEAALKAGFIAANTNFRPNDLVSKSEALKMVMQAKNVTKAEGVEPWQKAYVDAAIEAGILSAEFTDYTAEAKRSMVITTADSAVSATSTTTVEEDDMELDLSDIFGDIDLGDAEETSSDEETTSEETTTEETTSEETTSEETTSEETTSTTTSDEDVLEVTLSPENPAGVNLPTSAAGVQVLKFDVTAGEEDVEINGLTFSTDGFGLDAVKEIAAYSDNGRISKSKSFNSDDEAELNVTDFTVKAGSTETITILANTHTSNIGEFYITLEDVDASSDVELDSVVSEIFDVLDVTAGELEVEDTNVTNSISSGESEADLAEFKLSNNSSDIDFEVTSITLKEEGSVDQEEVLSNLVLLADGDEVATVASMEGKYVTFNFDAIEIEDGKNVTFKLQADVNGGAGDKVQFAIDDKMDISVSASKYNAANIILTNDTFTEVSIDAGEVTIYAIDAESDEIRSDKDDVELGQLKIVNTSGKALALQQLAVELSSNTGTLATIFEEDTIEMVVNNSSETLDGTMTSSTGSFESDDDLGITIPEGTTYITIKADTLKNVAVDTEVSMTLTASNLVLEETEDDEKVSDITPSSLSWDEVTFVNSTVKVSNVPLADVTVVKGSSDLVALQFEIEAGSASSVVLDEAKAKIYSTGTTVATSDEITAVALYKGSVSDSNLLDQVSGSKLASGVATFDGFEVEIDADESETFIIVVSISDVDTVAGKEIRVTLEPSELSLEDSDGDTVTATETTLSDKVITVTKSGSLAARYDAGNDANDDSKTILAGETEAVVSYDVEATNEEIDVETVKFTATGTGFTTNKGLTQAVETATLYLDGTLIATADNSDIEYVDANTATISFEDMDDLIIPTESVELELRLNTANIGYEKVGEAISGVTITKMEMTDAKGVDSNEDASDVTVTTTSEEFAIVPSVVTPTVYTSLNNSSTPQISIYANAGDNSEANSLSTPKTLVNTITFSTLGTTDTDKSIVYTLVNIDDTTDSVTGAVDYSANTVTFDLASNLEEVNRSISSSSTERFKIVITGTTTDDDTVELTLVKNGITYTVSDETVTTNLTDEVEFGSRSY